MTKILSSKTLLMAASSLLLVSAPSYADNHTQSIDLPIASQSETTELSGKTTHSIIRLTPDKSELIKLDEPAASIIVGNPAHANVIADSAQTLVIIPRLPGATHFTVIGKQGQVIMQRHIIVASPKQDYLRVKRTCEAGDENCEKTSVFYCPDMCHEIAVEKEQGDAPSETGEANNTGGNANPPPPVPSNNAPDEGPDQ